MGVRNTEEDMFQWRLKKNRCSGEKADGRACLGISKGRVVGTWKGQGMGHGEDGGDVAILDTLCTQAGDANE